MIKLNKPQAIFFDWDDTVVNTVPIRDYTMKYTLEQFRHLVITSPSADDYSILSAPLREYFAKIFGINAELVMEEYRLVYDNSIKTIGLNTLPHAIECIKKIHSMGIKLAVISNKFGPTLRKEVEALKLSDYFFAIVGAGDCARHKPEKDQVDYALTQTTDTIDTTASWFIGDTDADLSCALKIGATPMFVGHMYTLDKVYTDLIKENKVLRLNGHKHLMEILDDLYDGNTNSIEN